MTKFEEFILWKLKQIPHEGPRDFPTCTRYSVKTNWRDNDLHIHFPKETSSQYTFNQEYKQFIEEACMVFGPAGDNDFVNLIALLSEMGWKEWQEETNNG